MNDLPPQLEELVERVLTEAHLDETTERRVRTDLRDHFSDGLARGRTPEELAARFGSPAEAARRLRRAAPSPRGPAGALTSRSPWLDALVRDLRAALRGVRGAPGSSLAITVVLALGVAASVVVSSIVNELLLDPLPVEDPKTLVDVWADVPGGNSFLGVSYADFEAYRRSGVLEDLAVFSGTVAPLGPEDSEATIVATIASPGYLDMLGIRPALGSTSFPRDEGFGEVSGVVITHGFWQRALGGSPDVIGSTLRLGEHVLPVIGVTEAGFRGHFTGFASDAFLPVSAATLFIEGFDPADRTMKFWEMIGRRDEDRGVAAVLEGLNQVAAGIEADFPEINEGHRLGVTPTTGVDHSMYAGVVLFAAILSTLSALVLVIACLNVGGILLVRGLTKDREIAVRLALGAGRLTLIRQMVTEAVVLVGIGAFLGAWVASLANAWLRDWIAALTRGRIGLDLAIDGRVVLLTVGATVLAAIVASGAPAVHLLRKDPANALRARSGQERRTARLRGALVVGQVAVSVVLCVAAVLFVRTLVVGAGLDPGFDADRVASFRLSLDSTRLGTAHAEVVLDDVLRAVRALPSVDAATWSTSAPLVVSRTPTEVVVPGVDPPPGQTHLVVDTRGVGPEYATTAGLALLQGRDFTKEDTSGPQAAIVNTAFVDRFWPEGDVLGRTFEAGGRSVGVIGVVANARYLLQDETVDPFVLLSAPRPPARPVMIVQAADPLSAAQALRAAVTSVLPSHPVVAPTTARGLLVEALLPQRAAAILVGAMGLIAIVLAAAGLYGLIQFTVTRDLPELGVRLALGAGRRDLLLVVLRRGFLLASLGVTAGLAVALLTAGSMGGLLPGLSPFDPLTYASVAALFGAVAFLSSWFPSARAASTDPMEALRGG